MKQTKKGQYYLLSKEEMEEFIRIKNDAEHIISQSASSVRDKLINDLIKREINSKEQLDERLKGLKLSPPLYQICALVSFENKNNPPFANILEELHEIFPTATINMYENTLLLLIPASRSAERPVYDESRLTETLEENHAYISISQPVRSLLSLPTMYQDCKRTLRLGPIYQANKRIFYAANYFFEKVAELCLAEENNSYHNGAIAYLCDPNVIALKRYDNEHNTNLTDVLYNYLMSGQSIAECSRNMFIHRNTLINKLSKIEEILGRKLDNQYLMYKMFFSFQIIKYADIVLKKQIDEFKK